MQHAAELVWVGVFAVNYNTDMLILLRKAEHPFFCEEARVGYLAEIRKPVLMVLIEKRNKFFVVVENIALFGCGPVEIDLIGIRVFVGIVHMGRQLDTVFGITVRHEEQFPEIGPVQPQGEELLAEINAVCDMSVDVDDVVIEFMVGLDQGGAVLL